MNAPFRHLGDHCESAVGYRHEIFRQDGWRIVACRDQIQWIIQAKTRTGRPDGGRWEGRHYCTTRDALIRLWRSETGDDGTALLTLLPERIKRSDST